MKPQNIRDKGKILKAVVLVREEWEQAAYQEETLA
jgi:hypothetical protein